MADTRTIYLHTGIETFSSDPSDSQFLYLDMSDYDNLNPQYQSTIKLSSGVAGIYESTKAKITLTFKGENSGRDARADWVNKYAERINKISVNTTENKSAVFNKSAVVSEVEFIDTPYIDGAQVIIEVTMFGRWQSALTVLDTVSEKYEGGTKTYLGEYYEQVGGRNLLLNTGKSITGHGTNSVNDNFISQGGLWQLSNDMTVSDLVKTYGEGRNLVLSFDWIVSSGVPSGEFVPQWANTPWTITEQKIKVSSENTGNHFSISVPLSSEGYGMGEAKHISFRQDYLTADITITNLKLELDIETPWSPAPEKVEAQIPHYTYNYTYGKTTLQNQIALPKDRNRFMLAIDSQYSVATITLSANGKRATISTSRLSANSSLSSDFVAYDITAFVDTDKFLLLNSGLVASVVWDNLASQYAVLYQIMNSVGDTPADISVTTTGGQHIPFKLYTYSIQDFI